MRHSSTAQPQTSRGVDLQQGACCSSDPALRIGAWGLPLVLTAVLSACAPTTRVILLPQESGKPSAIEVTTSHGTQQIKQPYQMAQVGHKGRISLENTSAEQVLNTYPSLVSMQPQPPEKFVLKFEAGSSQLTAESQAYLSVVVARAQARLGGEIMVTGHTDRKGTLEDNDRLSLQRADAIRALLIERGFKAELVEAVGRGEREPLWPTADEVIEPRNRRVEVLVR